MKVFFKFLEKIKKRFGTRDKAERAEISIMFICLGKDENLLALEPENLVEILREYINLVINTICKFNGIIVRYIADDLFAIFRNKEHQKFACESAIEIIERFKKWKEAFPLARKIPSLKIAIGISTGEAIILTSKDFYDVWGESVTIAMRLRSECLNLEKQNLVSESTYEPVKDIVSAKNTDEVLVNMKDKQIKAYELVSQNVF